MPRLKGNFVKSFEELEKIVAKFEEGRIDLDEALVEFERGLKLVEGLKGRLKEVENKVVVLKKQFKSEEVGGEVEE
ncbi:exodeoxyribonuclease VII small subunit [Candidatus Uhrbacteria bacterium RIFCSPLOWO2_02_FULL_49_11]|uniref:Exodeoxyribonuclease 7 small subunit n=1 Tax=Candidatus Uhrbacteria bacterium RIFCSPLOWO2_02_FULL_49_11 TaxID=1802409 RepID=A0A1F7VCD3_9BACT|nr:MAG: exodeoxyribonuclease VII small subunit [Candidatus Uhrbacteria bacterium RIFCSPLOWO2_02_FULL_49_11]